MFTVTAPNTNLGFLPESPLQNAARTNQCPSVTSDPLVVILNFSMQGSLEGSAVFMKYVNYAPLLTAGTSRLTKVL